MSRGVVTVGSSMLVGDHEHNLVGSCVIDKYSLSFWSLRPLPPRVPAPPGPPPPRRSQRWLTTPLASCSPASKNSNGASLTSAPPIVRPPTTPPALTSGS